MIDPAKIQVRFADCDMMGHVNNAVYLSYFELARMHYFEQIIDQKWDWKKQGIVLVKNSVEYLAPVFLHDQPNIFVKVSHIGNKSFTMTYELHVNGVTKTKGESVLVCFDFVNNKTADVYPEMKEALKKIA